jgi:uncharacterized protein YnzC (UPF0291/DUF896 family)
MDFSFYDTITVAGVEIAVAARVVASYVDNGIGAYEYGSQRCVDHDYAWEIDDVYDLAADESIRDACARDLEFAEFPKVNRRRYLKALRRKVRAVTNGIATLDPLDPTDAFDDEKLVDEAEKQSDKPWNRYHLRD